MSHIGKIGMSMILSTLWLCASASQIAAQTYSIIDLGTLPGNSVSKASALNNAGEAAGVSETPTAAIATMFSGGKATSISTLGSSVSLANAINDSGEIAGWNSYNSNPNFDPQAFLLQQRQHAVHQLATPVLFRHRGLWNK